mmetsp:Transcript_10003/g.26552  ORF Transcript_10003/g.26552 Transcript_10003/m.26552 type:complete len:389 (-) Transcript_10003:243-1409(-)
MALLLANEAPGTLAIAVCSGICVPLSISFFGARESHPPFREDPSRASDPLSWLLEDRLRRPRLCRLRLRRCRGLLLWCSSFPPASCLWLLLLLRPGKYVQRCLVLPFPKCGRLLSRSLTVAETGRAVVSAVPAALWRTFFAFFCVKEPRFAAAAAAAPAAMRAAAAATSSTSSTSVEAAGPRARPSTSKDLTGSCEEVVKPSAHSKDAAAPSGSAAACATVPTLGSDGGGGGISGSARWVECAGAGSSGGGGGDGGCSTVACCGSGGGGGGTSEAISATPGGGTGVRKDCPTKRCCNNFTWPSNIPVLRNSPVGTFRNSHTVTIPWPSKLPMYFARPSSINSCLKPWSILTGIAAKPKPRASSSFTSSWILRRWDLTQTAASAAQDRS